MACPECNAHTPFYLQLCETCIKRKNASRGVMPERHRAPVLSASRIEIEPALVTKSLAVLLAGIVALSLLTALFLVTGPVKSEGPIASFAFATTAALGLICFSTYALFWMRLVVMDPMWAIGSIFMPCLVWKYLQLSWHESQVRSLALLHFASLLLMFGSYAWLAKATNLSYIETVAIFAAYADGEEINVTEYKNGAAEYSNYGEYDVNGFK